MRILLATDSDILRPRLWTILTEVPQAEMLQDVSEERMIVEAARSTNPDIIIIAFPGLGRSTNRVVPDLRRAKPGAVIIVLTTAFNEVNEGAWREAGATFVFDLTLQLDDFIDSLKAFSASAPGQEHQSSGHELSSAKSQTGR